MSPSINGGLNIILISKASQTSFLCGGRLFSLKLFVGSVLLTTISFTFVAKFWAFGRISEVVINVFTKELSPLVC